jgi:hypothetical protein
VHAVILSKERIRRKIQKQQEHLAIKEIVPNGQWRKALQNSAETFQGYRGDHWFDILDFGAVGDGIHNDTVRIHRARV